MTSTPKIILTQIDNLGFPKMFALHILLFCQQVMLSSSKLCIYINFKAMHFKRTSHFYSTTTNLLIQFNF